MRRASRDLRCGASHGGAGTPGAIVSCWVDALVNNAGVMPLALMEELGADEWSQTPRPSSSP